MKKCISAVLIAIFLLTLCTSAIAEDSPLGLYSMLGEYIGIGMQRSEIEAILGEPLNNPFPHPTLSESFKGNMWIRWDDISPFYYFDFRGTLNNGYYCVYNGNIIVQYDYGFTGEEFKQEPILQLYHEMSNDILSKTPKYDDADWETFLPEMIALNDKYAQISQADSVAILISTIGFEFSTHDGIYVGKTGVGDYWSFSRSYEDIEEFYFANQTQYRKLDSEQIDSSLSTDKYSEKDFVGIGISVRDSDGMVEEICIKRLDAGNEADPCDVMNQYEDFLRYSIYLPN